MGAKYTSKSASGYNSAAPPDDGTKSGANRVTWAGIRSKLTDVLKTFIETINTAIVSALDTSVTTTAINYITTPNDHQKPILCTSTVTVSLGTASVMGAGYQIPVVNYSSGLVTVNLNTATDTLLGVVNGSFLLNPSDSCTFGVNSTTDGYTILGRYTNSSALNSIRNRIPNSSCAVAQRLTAPNLTTSRLIGQVDCFAAWASGGAVSAGTIAQNTAAISGSTGFAVKAAGVTLTGAGVMSCASRIESRDSKQYKNKTCSFQVAVDHDVGSAVNYTIIIKKATVADNWTSTTTISTSSATSVPSATATVLKFQNVAMGDCSNGIEIEVQAACGAITTKNFNWTEWSLDSGSVCPVFAGNTIESDVSAAQRYLASFTSNLNGGGQIATGQCYTTTNSHMQFSFPTSTRIAPTGVSVSNVSHFDSSKADSSSAGAINTIAFGAASTEKVGIVNITLAGANYVAGNATFMFVTSTSAQILFTGSELF